MMLFLISLFLIASCQSEQNWAVLVAGSKGYENFRHQADICQSFQQIKSQGIPEERIIVFMYDDIAHNWENPHKGSIINYKDGPNVYPGVPHDYTKENVTPENFLKVLRGEEMKVGSKKTLKSTENDNVFVYFADHGAPGLIAFPSDVLHAKDLLSTFQTMFQNKMYKKLVIYVEACESGSMFNGILPSNMSIYAVTASNPFESSYACDHDWKYLTYLNDCWSRDWLANSRDAISKGEMNKRTLLEQFDSVHNVSTKSPECAYGDLTFRKDLTLIDFQGQKASEWDEKKKIGEKSGMVSSRYVKYDYFLRRVDRGGEWKKKYEEYVVHMKRMDEIWIKFGEEFGVKMKVSSSSNDDDCYKEEGRIELDCNKQFVDLAEKMCGKFDDYSLQYVSLISQGCREKKLEVQKVKNFFAHNC